MRETPQKIRQKFAGKLIGSRQMQDAVCLTLSIFPDKIIDYVTKNVWFVSSFDDAWGFTFQGSDLEGRYLIFLSDELLSQPKPQKMYTIAHEVGHVILKHKNAILEMQTKKETDKQEKEADEFAKLFLDEI